MTDEQMIVELAKMDDKELDMECLICNGLGLIPEFDGIGIPCQDCNGQGRIGTKTPYLISYDAIIPLIQKQRKQGLLSLLEFENTLHVNVLTATPYQLSTTLLKARGVM